MTAAIAVQGLSHRYGGVQAVKDIGFEIAAGEIYAAPAILPMTMGTLLLQKQIMARLNHARVFEVRNVLSRIGGVANENGGDRRQHQSVHHGN